MANPLVEGGLFWDPVIFVCVVYCVVCGCVGVWVDVHVKVKLSPELRDEITPFGSEPRAVRLLFVPGRA